MTTRTISSQRHLDESIVADKLAAEDYVVTVSPVFEIGGEGYAVVLDGHHSLEAARRAGVEPTYREADIQTSDRVALLARGEIDDFLVLSYIDSPYYDIATGAEIW